MKYTFSVFLLFSVFLTILFLKTENSVIAATGGSSSCKDIDSSYVCTGCSTSGWIKCKNGAVFNSCVTVTVGCSTGDKGGEVQCRMDRTIDSCNHAIETQVSTSYSIPSTVDPVGPISGQGGNPQQQ